MIEVIDKVLVGGVESLDRTQGYLEWMVDHLLFLQINP